MELRCSKCNSTDLKKISLAYQEGAFRTEAQTRMRTALIGGSGPDVLVGRACTRASYQSALGTRFTPPTKWSYRKVVFWSGLVFLCGAWLVFYLNTITKNSAIAASPALTAYALISTVIFTLILALAVRHNQSVYPKRLA